MTDSSTDFGALVARVQLKDVRLIELHAKTLIRDIRALKNPQLVTNYGAKVIGRQDSGFWVGGLMKAQVVNEGDEPTSKEESPVFIDVFLALEYFVEGAKDFSDDVLHEFAESNATFNAWPYWREHIQSSVARMNLPPLTLPVLRLNRARKAVSSPKDETSKGETAKTARSARTTRKKR